MFERFKSIALSAVAIFITLFNISFALVIVYIIWQNGHNSSVVQQTAGGKTEVEYKDYVVILLTALSVMIALGGVLAAFLAVFGYVEGKKLIERNVKREVDEELGPMVERRLMDFEARQSALTGQEEREVKAIIDGLHGEDQADRRRQGDVGRKGDGQ